MNMFSERGRGIFAGCAGEEGTWLPKLVVNHEFFKFVSQVVSFSHASQGQVLISS